MSLEKQLERIADALEKLVGETTEALGVAIKQETIRNEIKKVDEQIEELETEKEKFEKENGVEEPLELAFRYSHAKDGETAKIRRDRIKKALSFTEFSDSGRQSTDYYEKKLKEILDANGLNTDHIVIETKKKAAPKPAETPQPVTPNITPEAKEEKQKEVSEKPVTLAKLNEVGKAHMKKFDYDKTKTILAKYSGNPNMVKTSEIPTEKRNACIAELQKELDNG